METQDPVQLAAENAALRDKVTAAELDRHVAYVRHRPLQVHAGRAAVTPAVAPPDDAAIVRRIARAYRAALEAPSGSDQSWWFVEIANIRAGEHDLLAGGTEAAIAAMLRDPRSNNLFYGFDNLAKDLAQPDPGWPAVQAQLCYDSLLRLAEAVGVVRLENPEAPIRADRPEVEAVLDALDEAFGFRIEFPNPFAGEVGLRTSRGVASYRCFQSLYQGWRIARLAPGGAVLEIGGGLGRTAFYAGRMGVGDYTIIDLPLTGVAQAYFLHRVGVAVVLWGEARAGGVRILPPSAFFDGSGRFDLVLNADSFTEMGQNTARDYFDEAARRTGRLLSINHEYNSHRVLDLVRAHPAAARATREPYWLRRGYVEEVVTFGPSGG